MMETRSQVLRILVPGLLGWSLAGPLVAAVEAQSNQYVYVSKVVGEWVATDSSPAAIHVLDRVRISATIGVKAPERATTSYSLVLRDPRTLRTATLSCDPTVRCRTAHHVSQLSFTGPAIETTPRTSRLFVHVAEDEEARGRVKLLGARGGGRDWGLMVLEVRSGNLDLSPLIERIGAVQSELVVRLCALSGRGAAGGDQCEESATEGPKDCPIDPAVACPMGIAWNVVRPVTAVVFERDGKSLSSLPVGFAAAVVASEAKAKEVRALASRYEHDLAALEGYVSGDELGALERAAAVDIARQRR